jgi:hypothetical protein
MKARAIPRGYPSLDIGGARGQHVIALAEHYIERRVAVT